ncbi:MAG TPA: DUF1684 domain-containing protein [Gemmatimonadales bacterium]
MSGVLGAVRGPRRQLEVRAAGRPHLLPLACSLLISHLSLPLSFSLLTSRASALAAQVPQDLLEERAAYARWLSSARTSPLAAIAQVPVGNGIRLGPPDADVPLDGLAERRITEHAGRVTLQGGGAGRALPRARPVPLGTYTLLASGEPGRTVISIFGPPRSGAPPAYFPYDSSMVRTVALEPPLRPAVVRLLAVDGMEVEAAEAGTVGFTVGGATTRLTVRRIPSEDDESDLVIYFRDPTNGRGSYPAGRFVTLTPLPDGRYRVDFNRARNPFCAYSSVYACPAPWPGNGLPAPVAAGERYEKGEG